MESRRPEKAEKVALKDEDKVSSSFFPLVK